MFPVNFFAQRWHSLCVFWLNDTSYIKNVWKKQIVTMKWPSGNTAVQLSIPLQLQSFTLKQNCSQRSHAIPYIHHESHNEQHYIQTERETDDHTPWQYDPLKRYSKFPASLNKTWADEQLCCEGHTVNTKDRLRTICHLLKIYTFSCCLFFGEKKIKIYIICKRRRSYECVHDTKFHRWALWVWAMNSKPDANK